MSRSLYDKLYRRFGETLPETKVSALAETLIDLDQKLWTSSLTVDCQAKLAKIRVAVVGAGFAGMMAAWWLCSRTDKNVEVVVFEAGDEVGGRVWSNESFTKGTRIIEFGAELVGANHPLWLETAREFGIGLLTRTNESDYGVLGLKMKSRVDGRDLSDKDAEQMTGEMKEIFKQIGKDAAQVTDPGQPWTQANLKDFDNMSVDDKLLKPPPRGLALTQRKLGYRGIQMQLENNLVTRLSKINYLGLLCLVKAGRFGTDKDDPDLLGFWQQTETFRCSNGCQALLKRMVAKLSDPKEKFKFTLLTNTAVTDIETDSSDPPKPVKLKWKSTAAVKRVDPGFDFAIVAVPPSVWDKINITPEHPKGSGPIQMGGAIKFFSNLKDRFWIQEGAAPSGIDSNLGMIWEGTDNQVQVGNSEVELSVFAGGPDIAGRDQPYYKRKLGELYSGYSASNAGRKTALVDWPSRKFIETGYSCPGLGHMFKTAPVLQKPFGTHLYLAGEHTQTDFFGFMEGALRSGRRAATAIISNVCPASFPNFPNA